MEFILKTRYMFLIFITLLNGSVVDNSIKIKDYLVKEYASYCQIEEKDVNIKLFHVPDTDFGDTQIRMVNKSKELQLGHCRAKLQLFQANRIIQEF